MQICELPKHLPKVGTWRPWDLQGAHKVVFLAGEREGRQDHLSFLI